jgi:hypothetical protein
LAISKTINCPHDTSVDEVEAIFRKAIESPYIKGCTIWRDGCREGVLETKKEPMTPSGVYQRPLVLHGPTYKVKPAPDKSSVYLTINQDDSDCIREVFSTSKQRSVWLDALCIVLSLALQHNVPASTLAIALSRISDESATHQILPGATSLPAVVGHLLLKVLHLNMVLCPSCNSKIAVSDPRCYVCDNCGYSGCSA